VNILLFRTLIFKYIHQYAETTAQENGGACPWFYSYAAAMNIALISAVMGAVLK
jgi:hypothetical protein